MTETKIVDVKIKPWWKFWKTANLEVTVEDTRGKRKTVSIYQTIPGSKDLFVEYVGYKYCTGDQFWDVHQRRKKIEKLPEDEKKRHILMQAMESVGVAFDCVDLLSKE